MMSFMAYLSSLFKALRYPRNATQPIVKNNAKILVHISPPSNATPTTNNPKQAVSKQNVNTAKNVEFFITLI